MALRPEYLSFNGVLNQRLFGIDYFTPITSPYSWFGNHLYTLEASVLHC